MSFQGPHFLFAISWILRSKNKCFIFLTILQKCFQFSKLFKDLYFSKSLLQFSFYQLLEYFVILITFKFLSQALSTTLTNSLMTLFRLALSDKLEVLRFLMNDMRSLTNNDFFLLSLMIEHFLELICSLTIEIVIVREA